MIRTAKPVRQPSILSRVKPESEDITEITVHKVRVKQKLDLVPMPLPLPLGLYMEAKN
jgi:hypothetical protein